MQVINKQMDEMKTLKTVISIPTLRNQLNAYNTRGVNFEHLLSQCEQIINHAWKGISITNPILQLAPQNLPKF